MRKMRKSLRGIVLLFVFMCIPLLTSIRVYAYSASANKLNTNYTLTGNGAEDIYSVAKAQLNKKYPEFAGFNYRAWCADFVSACAAAAGVSDVIPGAAAVANLRTNIIKAGGTEYLKVQVQNGKYTPVRGDIIIFKSNGDSHVGIVDKASDGKIYYIDGNNTTYGNGNNASVHYSNCAYSYAGFTCVVKPKYKNSNSFYNSYGFDAPSSNSTITESTFLFQGWIDAKKKISTITCSINHGTHYVEAALYKRPDVPNATAFRAEVNSNLLKTGKNDVALCVNFADGTATVVENRSVTWSPKLIWGYDSPTDGMKIVDNQFQFYGWIESARKLSRVTCSLNQGEKYLTANLYKRPDVPNATAFRLDIDTSNLHYGDNYVSVCAYYADGSSQTIATRKVIRCISDAIEYPQNNEKFTCKNSKFLLQGWSTNDSKTIDHFAFTINGTKFLTSAHTRSDLSGNARYYREEILLSRLKNGNNKIEIFAYYTDGTSRNIGQVNVVGDMDHKWDAGKITQLATCTKTGIKLYTCTNCKTTKKEAIPATGKHQNTELRNKKEATCTTEGYTGDTYCKDCGTKLQDGKAIAKKAHTWDAGKITQEATCAKTGIKTYTCAVCKTTKTEEVPVTGVHKNTELRNVKEATCTEEGYTGDTYCKDCGSKIASGQKINKPEHIWNSGVVTTPPTCIERGVKTYTCIICKTTKIQLGKEGANKNLHKWDTGTVTKAATCTESGVKTYSCTLCKTTKTEEIPATGNHEHTELRDVRKATCAEDGYTGDLYCKDCGTKLQTGKVIAKKAHTWDAGVITTPATCTEKGIKTYTCTSCGGTKTNELPSTGHKQKEVRNKRAATCIQSGYTGDTYCMDCGKKLSSGKAIAKLAHKWDAGVITQEATCTEAGIKTYTCTVCESTKIEELPANGHGEAVTKFAKKATCKTEGYTGDLYCKDCGELLEEGSVIAKLPHQWDAGKITKKATTTTTGIRTYTCTKCGATKKETIPKVVPKKATPGKTIKDTATNGIYKVLADGLTVTFVRPAVKKATVRIPETVKVSGVTCKVTEISANAFKDDAVLKTVVIGKNVKTIGVNAFYGCKNLTKVSGGAGLVTICDRAFLGCAALQGIVLPSTVTGIGKQAFYNCRKLRSITINTLSLTSKNVGAQAFTGTYAKAVVKVPAKKFTAYKSLLRTKGMSINAVYTK